MSKLSRLERTHFLPESHDEVSTAAAFVPRPPDRNFDFRYGANAELLA